MRLSFVNEMNRELSVGFPEKNYPYRSTGLKIKIEPGFIK